MMDYRKLIPAALLLPLILAGCGPTSSDSSQTSSGPDGKYTLIDDVYYQVDGDAAEVALFKNVDSIAVRAEVEIDGKTYPVKSISNLEYNGADQDPWMPYQEGQGFQGYSNIKSLRIPEGIESINKYGLAFLTSVETLVLPNSIRRMEQGSLYRSSGITTLTLPSFGEDNGLDADFDAYLANGGSAVYFDGDTGPLGDINATYTFLDESLCLSRCFASPEVEFNKDIIEHEFPMEVCLETVNITGGISLFPYSFAYLGWNKADGLEINLAETIEKAHEYCFTRGKVRLVNFASLDQYAHFQYGNGWSYIPSVAERITIAGSSNLGDLVIPEGVMEIYPGQYSFVTSLTSIIFPDSLEALDDSAFGAFGNAKTNYYEGGFYYGSLANPYMYLVYVSGVREEMKVHEDCKFIKKTAFQNGVNLKKVTLIPSVTVLFNSMFYGLTKLRQVEVDGENRIERIGDLALSNTALESIRLPKTIKYIGNSAFAHCPFLNEMTYEDGIEGLVIGAWAFNGTFLGGNFLIPEGTVEIGRKAFSCEMDQKITIYLPSTLKYIAPEWFGMYLGYGESHYRPEIFMAGNFTWAQAAIAEIMDTVDIYYSDRLVDFDSPALYEHCYLYEEMMYQEEDDGWTFLGRGDGKNLPDSYVMEDEVGGMKVTGLRLIRGDSYPNHDSILINESLVTITITIKTPDFVYGNGGNLENIVIENHMGYVNIYLDCGLEGLKLGKEQYRSSAYLLYLYSEVEKPYTDGIWFYHYDEQGRIVLW